jgi:hypothetical protein
MTAPLARIPARLVLLAFGAASALHADRAPLWCTLAVGCNLLWYWLHVTGRVALPGRWGRYLLTAILLVLVLGSRLLRQTVADAGEEVHTHSQYTIAVCERENE